MALISFAIFGISTFCQIISAEAGVNEEKRLIKHLIDNYKDVGTIGRPVHNTEDMIKVNFGLAIIQIINVDEKSQTIKTKAWIRHLWQDVLLKWDPREFGGVSQVGYYFPLYLIMLGSSRHVRHLLD